MKKGWIVFILVFALTSFVSASCSLSVSMVNQDPYPAVPGDYVKLVFQVDGVQDPSCGEVTFELMENYPLIFDPDTMAKVSLKSGTFVKDYSSHLIVPYKVRLDSSALDGSSPIEVRYSYEGGSSASFQSKEFNLSVEDIKADFDVFVKNFEASTSMISFEILNIAKTNVQAITMEVPQQNNIQIKGANKNIVGDLDSNEYTSTDFEAIPQKGDMNLIISYTDKTGVRRTMNKTVSYDPVYFTERKAQETGSNSWKYILGLVIVVLAIWYFRSRNKKKKI